MFAVSPYLLRSGKTQVRTYASFLKDLPRSAAGLKGQKQNRFAAKYDQEETRTEYRGEPRFQNQRNTPAQDQKYSPNRIQGQRSRNAGPRVLPDPVEGDELIRNGLQHSGYGSNDGRTPSKRVETEAQKVYRYQKLKQSFIKKLNVSQPAKSQQQQKRRPQAASKQAEKPKIQIPTFITVANLAFILNVPLNRFLKRLSVLGFEEMTHNYILDKENASLIADEYGFDIVMNDDTGLDLFPAPEVEAKLVARAPVVTIMGHVDHGKTTILDYLRKSSIVDQEHGGITQHIGAFSVTTPISKKQITFLDTPGHAAFLKMRERGAIITDIVILVVAADDSVMPQTIEAIKHAKKSGVPMIVAINKCDKDGLNVDKVLSDLARYEVDIEDYGGETQTVQVSGKTGLNMDKLEEAVITLSEMSDFKAEKTIPAEGWVIESQQEKGLGNIATMLVRRGTLKTGSFIVAGNTYCKVRGMKDEHGKNVKIAGPSTPVRVWGWRDLPQAGDQILEAKNEKVAKKVCENRVARSKQMQSALDIEKINAKRKEELKELERQEKINELKLAGLSTEEFEQAAGNGDNCITLKYIIKSDVFGSAEAIKESIDGLGNDEVKAVVISHEAGAPSDSDIDTAKALGARIICFNTKASKQIQGRADQQEVKFSEHNIIYRLIEEVTEELTSKLKPRIETKVLSTTEVKDIFTIAGRGGSKTKIAGCKVNNGNLKRSDQIRVLREGNVVYQGALSSLKQVKDDITEAKKGQECGLAFNKWDKFQQGDIIEAYEEVTHQRYL